MTAIELAIRILEGIAKDEFLPDVQMHTRGHCSEETTYYEIYSVWIEPKNGKLCIE